MKAILYARFSPRRNADSCESVETQFDLIKDFCGKNNHEIVGEYSDRALSGSDEERPGLWAAIDALRRNYALIVYRLDRLARSVYLSNIIERAVEKRGATILSVSGEGTDSDTDEDKLIRQILQSFAEYQRKVIIARTSAAMLRHQLNGRRMSRIAPYGWTINPDDAKRLLPVPSEQEIIKKIADLKGSGLLLREIADKMNADSIKPRPIMRKFKDKTVLVAAKWTPQKIQTVLKRV